MKEEKALTRKQKTIIAVLVIIGIVIIILLICNSCKGGNGETSKITEIKIDEESSITVSDDYSQSDVQSDPNGDISNSDSDVTNSGEDTSKPSGNTSKPEGETSKPDDNTSKPEGETSKPGDNTSKPGGETSKPGDNTSKPSVDNEVRATVKISNVSSIYGDSIKEPTLTVSIENGNVTETELRRYITVSKQGGTNVGEYSITGKCSQADWKISFIDGVYTIKPRGIKVSANNQESYVGEKLKTLAYKLDGKIVGNDRESDLFSISTNATGKQAGKFAITVNVKANRNYQITVRNAIYTVKERPAKPDEPSVDNEVRATVKISNVSSIYGDSIKEPTLTVSIENGNVTETELRRYITVSKQGGTNIGEYSITGKCSKADWKITFINGMYTITPRRIKVIANDQQSYVGEQLKALTYKLEGKIVGNDREADLFSISTTATGNQAGKFDIIVNAKTNLNYQIIVQNAVYTVDKKPAKPGIPGENTGNNDPSSKPNEDETPARPGIPTESEGEDNSETETPSSFDSEGLTMAVPGIPSEDYDNENGEYETPERSESPTDGDF